MRLAVVRFIRNAQQPEILDKPSTADPLIGNAVLSCKVTAIVGTGVLVVGSK
jgi:hypothetical protein